MSAALARAEELFSDRTWRLDNLYKIKDKGGNAIQFKLNPAQRQLLDQLWSLNLILKARQLGFTTLIQLLLLDACLFNSNTSAGIIAHTREDAEAFFDDKIKFAYDNLDPDIRAVVSATQDSAKSLTFSNGSRIRVGTSLRSGTFQYLHVSEFGKICARFPDKAKEIVTGAFNAVQAGQFIAVESTAEGQGGKFHDMVMEAKRHAELQRPLTQLDFKLHFFPWYLDPSYALSDADSATVEPSDEDEQYFERLFDLGVQLTEQQEAWYIKKRAQQGDDMKREYPSTPDEAFEASIEGAYFSKEMERVRRERRIVPQIPVENLPVDTFWDLGVNDDMVIWFRQRVGPEHRFVGYYANSGEGLKHYALRLDQMAKEREWTYGTHHLPHDGKVRRLAHEAKSVEQMLHELGVKPTRIVPRIQAERIGIEASRAYLPRCWFDEKYTSEGIRCLDNYRKEWDEDRGVWKDRARHDWASHGYKAFETAAVAREEMLDEESDDAGRFDDDRDERTGY